MGAFYDALTSLDQNHFIVDRCKKMVSLCCPRMNFVQLIEKSEAYTFLVEDLTLMRRCILRIPCLAIYENEESLKRFVRGGRIQHKVRNRGGGVPEVYDMEEPSATNERCFILMEYVPNHDLYEYMTNDLKSTEEKAEFFCKLLYTVKKLHDEGFIHRDLKPSNFIVKKSTCNPYLIDFGISKEQRKMSLTNAVGVSGIGTPIYVSPEQRNNLCKADKRSDIYSLGRMFYVILSGHIFSDEKEKMDEEKLPGWGWYSIVEKATERKPKNRYQDISEFIADIEAEVKGVDEDLLGSSGDATASQDDCKYRDTMRLNFLRKEIKKIEIFDTMSTDEDVQFIQFMLLCKFNPGRYRALTNSTSMRYEFLLNRAIGRLTDEIENSHDYTE